jgi:RNA polymerase sigma-70 factor (ECF subfamily)
LAEPRDDGIDDDRRLVRRVLAGDEAAFESLFEEASRGLFRFVVSRLGCRGEAADEIVQRTLTQALRKLHTYRGEAALFTWLCAICRREIGAHWQRQRRSAREVPLEEDDPSVRAALDVRAVAEQAAAVERSDVARRVNEALATLPPRYGDVLEWKYVEEVPVEEVGRRLGLGLRAAESVLARARHAFRRALAHVAGAAPGPGRTE